MLRFSRGCTVTADRFCVFLRTRVWNEALWDVTKGANAESLQGPCKKKVILLPSEHVGNATKLHS